MLPVATSICKEFYGELAYRQEAAPIVQMSEQALYSAIREKANSLPFVSGENQNFPNYTERMDSGSTG